MKKLTNIAKLLCIIFILFAEGIKGQLYYLDDYPGIPIMAFTNIKADSMAGYPMRLQRLKELGIMGFWARDVSVNNYATITGEGIKVFPYQWFPEETNPRNYVVYYTEGVYIKWQAEGKGAGANGDVELKFNSGIGEHFTEGTIEGIKTKSSMADTLVFGPWYGQSREYKMLPPIGSGDFTIRYTANYRLKIKNKIPLNDLPSGYLSSPVCTIQIRDRGFNPGSEFTYYDTTLTVNDFLNSSWGHGWDQWSTFPVIDYTLNDTANHYWNMFMQYEIQWAGCSFLDLYVDYIEISDVKGRQVKTPAAATEIINLVDDYADTTGVLGWFGLNEPPSIDNAEAFRIVDSLVHSVNNNLHLYTTFYTGSGGCFGSFWPQNFPGNGPIHKGVEFLKRSKLPFLSFNNYMYDDPWLPPTDSSWPHTASDYYIRNINEVAINNLHKLDSAGVPFSYSTQTGKFYVLDTTDCHDTYTRFYVPTPAQMLYHINLGLLYCMRELTIDPVFTLRHFDERPGYPCYGMMYREGLVGGYSPYAFSELGYTWKDTVAPRMSGLLGKTSRMLTTSSQHLNLSHSQYTNLNLNCIEGINLGAGSNFTLPSYLDFGFFDRQTEPEANYFMLINRYYSSPGNNKFILNFQNIAGYKNWNLRNFVDTSEVTILSDVSGNGESPTYTINSGDGTLYSLSPVVLYGGTLIADEITGDGWTLKGDMTIDNNATLSIYGDYYAQGDIIVKSGSVVNEENGEIHFQNGKKLIIEGTATISGTANEKLVLDFGAAEDENGIVVETGGLLNISYCAIGNAVYGINANLNTSGLYIYNSDFSGCSNSSINITGQTGDGGDTPPPPEIKYCTITGTLEDWGISVFNLSEIIIQENDIQNTNVGIFISQVPYVHVINNTITNNTYSSVLQGILMTSVGGDVRGNTISHHSEGIRLGNSTSVNIGGNEIHDCKYHAIFIDVGSNPYMIGRLIYDINFHG